jgi:thymidylate synthase (FAD)
MPLRKVLDHGYVDIIETWGSDERIIESARMSTDGAFRGWGDLVTHLECDACKEKSDTARSGEWHKDCPGGRGCFFEKKTPPGDEKLLKYLYTHGHMTPFEQAGVTFEVQAPIFVFREWHRHRTQSYNELSARYTELPDMCYVPSVERMLMSSAKNKQAQGTGVLSEANVELMQELIRSSHVAARRNYDALLRAGVPREIARVVIPVSQYSRMRASANLRNWLQFMTLRCDENAQWEIRQYAWIVADWIAMHFPRTYELWNVSGPKLTSTK